MMDKLVVHFLTLSLRGAVVLGIITGIIAACIALLVPI